MSLLSSMSLWGLLLPLRHAQVRLLTLDKGGAHCGMHNYRPSNHPPDFAENWVKGVYICL